MKKNFGIILAVALGLSALLLTIAFQAGWVRANPFNQERVGAPTIVSYQGQIWDGANPYNGTGYFKFAIYDTIGVVWSNDNSDPPTASISLPVSNGLFSVLLGDTGMTPLTSEVFKYPNTYLRVWFSPNGSAPWTQMPDQKIAAVPYALSAQAAYNAKYFDNMKSSDFQLRVSNPCPDGQAINGINSDGSVVCENISAGPQFTLSEFYLGTSNQSGFFPSLAIGMAWD